MASVKNSPLLTKLQKALAKRFPSPDTVKLEDHDGIIGIITSHSFYGMDSIDRQTLIGKLVAANLTKEERQKIQIIVGVTPEEETGYLAAAD